MEKPSFYAIIPAHVRYCKDLEFGAKLLYGEITALANERGYCWATNRYFASTYDVDVSTIKRWIMSLRDHGFIKTDVEKTGIQTVRKIWLSAEIKKMSTKVQKCAAPHSDSVYGGLKNEPQNNTVSITSKKETTPTPSKGEFVNFGKFVKLTQEEYNQLAVQFGGTDTLNPIIEEINDYLASTGKKPYQDYAATIRNWMRRRKGQKATTASKHKEVSEADNRTWWSGLEKILSPYAREGKLYTGSDYAEFSVRGNIPEKLYFKDPKFQEMAKNYLRKLQIFV